MPSHLELVAVGPLPGEGEELLDWLARVLRRRLGVPVRRGAPLPLRPEWWDAPRGQYRSNQIVDELIERDGGEPPGHWVLGVTAADLYAEERRFVFGEATVGGAWAVISLARLGSASGEGAMGRRRALKEALHELGHVAGLDHCEREECVMHASRGVVDTDRKSSSYCPGCRERLRDPSGVDGGSYLR